MLAHNEAVKPRPSVFEIQTPPPRAGGPWNERAVGSKQQPESSEFWLSGISFIGKSPYPHPNTHLFFFFWEVFFFSFFPLCFVYGASLLSHSWNFNLIHLCTALGMDLTRVVRGWRKGRYIWSHRQSGLSQKSVCLLYTVGWYYCKSHQPWEKRLSRELNDRKYSRSEKLRKQGFTSLIYALQSSAQIWLRQ